MPLGSAWIPNEEAYNFSLYSQHAREVTLLFFGQKDPATPIYTFPLDRIIHRTTQLWHCRLPKWLIGDAHYYAYRIEGPSAGESGWRTAFDPEKVLLDPYSRAVYFPPGFDRCAARRPGSNAGKAPLGVLAEESPFDWENDKPPGHRADLFVYEMHVRGFTQSPTSGVPAEKRGTFAGIIEKIPYLQELGVNAVELMPVQQFDPQENNYWGYMTLNFFAPHQGYAMNKAEPINEFRAMVKALHKADIEVILDVVYNHTAEGDERGPCYSYRGIDNETYYLLTGNAAEPYQNHSGTGNTLSCANPPVQALIVDSLRYWVEEMHVDGFRFDLAASLTRNADGSINDQAPPLLADIRTDPVVRNVRLIAEPWDCGTYQLGSRFPGRLWHQWNGMFRDEIRRFVRGDRGMIPDLMQRLYGSDDLFPESEAYRPLHSINYVISHDGFTLYDLTSYNERHNLANGHGNADGCAENLSWNCGHEGDEGVPDEVLTLRKKQAKNIFALLLLANGIPMFVAGDEFLHTQRGNNNPYNQDNETAWLDWSRRQEHADHFRFVRALIAFRRAHRTLCRTRFWRKDVAWYGPDAAADLSAESQALAYFLSGAAERDCDLYVMINAAGEPRVFRIQEGEPGEWSRVFDTHLPSPEDIVEPGGEPCVETSCYEVAGHSTVMLMRARLA
ncbi:MAG: isoamylase [Verrucomicrobiota bacterium]|nr:isoamylase [Verrucomicrobiota bacterium]